MSIIRKNIYGTISGIYFRIIFRRSASEFHPIIISTSEEIPTLTHR